MKTNNTRNIAGEWVENLLLIIILCSGVFILGGSYGEEKERNRAIKANVAKWTIDEKTGRRTFVYLTNAPALTKQNENNPK